MSTCFERFSAVRLTSAAIAAGLLLGFSSGAAVAGCIAGVAPFKAGTAGIVVKHSPIKGKHSVVVSASNTAGYSPTSEGTYFNVLKLTPNTFQVQHKRTDNGVPVKLDTNVSLQWIACTR